MAAYSYYSQDYYYDAEYELNRFLKVYPNEKSIPYAHYLLGMVYYERIIDEKKDLKPLVMAEEKFKFIEKNYPNTDFALDSSYKLDLIKRLSIPNPHSEAIKCSTVETLTPYSFVNFVQYDALETLNTFGKIKLFFLKSDLLNTIPVFGGAGNKVIVTFSPEWRPMPLNFTVSFKVFWFNTDIVLL